MEPSGLIQHWQKVKVEINRASGKQVSLQQNWKAPPDLFSISADNKISWNLSSYLLQLLPAGYLTSCVGFASELIFHRIMQPICNRIIDTMVLQQDFCCHFLIRNATPLCNMLTMLWKCLGLFFSKSLFSLLNRF
jgi:hypothetical protein